MKAQASGLGDYFTSCLRADIEGLRFSAGIHRIVEADYHRLLSRVFPYGIFYTFEPPAAIIWAMSLSWELRLVLRAAPLSFSTG